MIDERRIEKAFKEYNEKVEKELSKRLIRKPTSAERYADTTSRQCAFNEGAKWAINEILKNLWHPASEEPRKEAKFLYQSSHDSKFYYYINKTDDILETYPNWSRYVRHVRVIQWLYVDDLLPKEGGEK